METIQKEKLGAPKAISDVWKNLVLVQARTAIEAYEKLTRIGKSEEGDARGSLLLRGKPAKTTFAGVADFGVVHDELLDGCEILWQNVRCPHNKVRNLIQPKHRLLKEAERELSSSARSRKV